jgi:hypothetical protein
MRLLVFVNNVNNFPEVLNIGLLFLFKRVKLLIEIRDSG